MFLEYYSFSFIHSGNLFYLVLIQEFCIVNSFWVTGTLHMRLILHKILHEWIQGVDFLGTFYIYGPWISTLWLKSK